MWRLSRRRRCGCLPASSTTLREVLNATGVVLHTNLGRAPLSAAAIDAVVRSAGTVDIEFDLATGARARRGRGTLEALAQALPDAGDVAVVNNGAAALLLAVSVLAAGTRGRRQPRRAGRDRRRFPAARPARLHRRAAARGRHHQPHGAARLRRRHRPRHRLHPEGAPVQLPDHRVHVRRGRRRARRPRATGRRRRRERPAAARSLCCRTSRTSRRRCGGARAW